MLTKHPRVRILPLVWLVVALFALGWLSPVGGSDDSNGTLTAPDPLDVGSDHYFELQHGGQLRSFELHLPPDWDNEPIPLVVSIHGATLSVGMYRKQAGLDRLADKHRFMVLYPYGTRMAGLRLWNAGTCCGWPQVTQQDDVGFILSALAQVKRFFPVDTSRVYVTGMSNGAMMTYRLALEAPEQFAAIAAVAGNMASNEFSPSRPISIMHIQSYDDPLLPYRGRANLPLPIQSGAETLKLWAQYADCPKEPTIDRERAGPPDKTHTWRAVRKVWRPCNANTEIVLWELHGAGHVWPGGYQPPHIQLLAGGAYDVIDASAEIWTFFQRHHLTDSGS
ncbi:MAG: PHB depolymerase family esterase [Pseudomonadota bacterium]|nr:PHB depolymerase family esterase [Pseudomonadota bacterium]